MPNAKMSNETKCRTDKISPFLLQPPLSELELHVLWDPAGVCAQEAAKIPKGVDKPQNVSICMQHCVEISKENIFYYVDVFIALNIDDRSV